MQLTLQCHFTPTVGGLLLVQLPGLYFRCGRKDKKPKACVQRSAAVLAVDLAERACGRRFLGGAPVPPVFHQQCFVVLLGFREWLRLCRRFGRTPWVLLVAPRGDNCNRPAVVPLALLHAIAAVTFNMAFGFLICDRF